MLLFSHLMLHFSAASAKASSGGSEILKESRSCTVQSLYHNVQLRSKLYEQVYIKLKVIIF
jgi:hypothetical protein